jgi:hypothetical protein
MRYGVCAAVLVAFLMPSAGRAIGDAVPSLRLVDRAPLTVRGANFKARELVRVTASVEEATATRSVRTGPGGGFTVRFLTLGAGRCESLHVVARGATGTRAVLKTFPPAVCQPVSQPGAAA